MSHLNKNLTVINLFGAPGTGKSTTAALLFALMKQNYINVELVTEYAKDLVWSERTPMFKKQDYIFAKQHDKLSRLVGKVDVAVTDSPLLTGLFYVEPEYPKTFAPFCFEVFNSFSNINIFLKRTKKYVPIGRHQTEAEADALQDKIQQMLAHWRATGKILGNNILHMPADELAVERIFEIYKASKNE